MTSHAPEDRRSVAERPLGILVPLLFAAVAALLTVACSSTPTADSEIGDGNAVPSTFTLSSTAFQDGGMLPSVYTCDGAGHSPPLTWTGAPRSTVEFAVMMTTLAKDGLKWNWVLYDIPGHAMSLARSNMSGRIAIR
jgi:phosphatidylethanolamine-binding protein (PEBP) family uncharacterized protein